VQIKNKYFITLGLVLGLLLANQIFIQLSLLNAQQDARIINIAGKQRLNTQKMYSTLLEEELNLQDFSITLETFRLVNEELIHRSSGGQWYQTKYDISQLDELTGHIEELQRMIALPIKEFNTSIIEVQGLLIDMLELSDEVVTIIENEQEFIIQRARIFELLITILSVLVIAYEVFVVMLPVLKRISISRQELYVQTEKLKQLIGMIGHDLRSPLQNIKTRIQLIRIKNPKQTQYHEDLDILMGSLESAEQIVQLMLDKNSEHPIQENSPVRLSKILEDVKRDLSPLIASTKATINLTGEAELDSNPTEIRLVFQNLISNAIKFAKEDTEGFITIEVKDTVSQLNVAVKDNGIGMSKELQSSIFDYRSRGSFDKNGASGYGIGLSHCKEIISDLGGRIWVKSEPGKGSEFHLELPK
jgi:signal transduction histidine kinase